MQPSTEVRIQPASAPSVQIISVDYGGLAQDSRLVADIAASCGWKVRTTWRAPFSLPRRVIQRAGIHKVLCRRFELNIFMQQPEKWWLPQARRSVVIPNADWFTDYGMKLSPEIHQMWCKTREAVDIFRGLGVQSIYLGFTSTDPTELVDATPEKNWREALHVAGSSPLKGTSLVIDAWARNPEWPVLNLVTSIQSHVVRAACAANIRLWASRLPAHELALLQLRCGVHVQPSEVEGYGHVLGESLAAGAAVVSVDAAPMNELVQDSRGYLVRCRPTTMHYLARRYEIVPEHFDQTLNAIWDTAIERLQDKGRSAREWYLANRTTFRHRLRELLTASAADTRSGLG